MVKKLNVLVLEDTALFRELIRKFLTEMGMDVRTEINGKKGLESIIDLPQYDLIITDWQMPELDGLEFVKRVRAMPNYKKTPIIMVTSENESENVKNAIMAGVNDFLIKPCNLKTLKDKLLKLKLL